MSKHKSEFQLIEAMLFLFGRFSVDDLMNMLDGKSSKIKHLTSDYLAAYQTANDGKKPYTIVTEKNPHEESGLKICRFFRAVSDFHPISIQSESQLKEQCERIIEHFLNFSGTSMSILPMSDNELIPITHKTAAAENCKLFGEFFTLETLLQFNGGFTLGDVADALKLEGRKQVLYIIDVYEKEGGKIKLDKKTSTYVPQSDWSPIALNNNSNPLEFIFNTDLNLL